MVYITSIPIKKPNLYTHQNLGGGLSVDDIREFPKIRGTSTVFWGGPYKKDPTI